MNKLFLNYIKKLFMIAGFLSLYVPTVSLAAQSTDDCAFAKLEETFLQRALLDAVFRYKRYFRYLPTAEKKREMEVELRETFNNRIPEILTYLSLKRDTKALVYSTDSACVWLLGKQGVLAKGVYDTAGSENLLFDLWSSLKVTAEQRSLKKRVRGELCDSFGGMTEDSGDQAVLALNRAARTLLPQPVAAALSKGSAGTDRLIIVPSANLRKVPFAALPVGEKYLIDHYSIVITEDLTNFGLGSNSFSEPASALETMNKYPSPLGARLRELKRQDVENATLIIGNPDLSFDRDVCWPSLPSAELEAKEVARVIGASPELGKKASYSFVSKFMAKNKNKLLFMYFATHGVSDTINPADGSYLALSERHMRGADLQKISLNQSPVVVLSACETGLGKEFPFGVYGLPEAWRYAGASQIVMSLWRVDDAGTGQLMKALSDNLFHEGGIEFALAEAIRVTKSSAKNPAIWAAFTVSGLPSFSMNDYVADRMKNTMDNIKNTSKPDLTKSICFDKWKASNKWADEGDIDDARRNCGL